MKKLSKSLTINQEFSIPGTNVILEKGDKICLSEMVSVKDLMPWMDHAVAVENILEFFIKNGVDPQSVKVDYFSKSKGPYTAYISFASFVFSNGSQELENLYNSSTFASLLRKFKLSSKFPFVAQAKTGRAINPVVQIIG